jgi:hypothetical protein
MKQLSTTLADGPHAQARSKTGARQAGQAQRGPPLEAGDFDQWLDGTVDQARELMSLAPVEVLDSGTTDGAPKELA